MKFFIALMICFISYSIYSQEFLSPPLQDAAMSTELVKRSEIDPKYTWNLTDIYKSEDLWEKDFKMLEEQAAAYKNFEGKLGSSTGLLYQCLQHDEKVGIKFEHLRMYSSLNKDLDLGNAKYQGMYDRVQALSSRINTAAAYIRPELLAIPEATLQQFISEKKELALYKHYFNNILRLKPNTLPKEQEELLALASPMMETAYSVFGLFKNADMQYPTIKDEAGKDLELSDGRYYADRAFRERAYKGYYKPYVDYKNTLGGLFNGQLKMLAFNAKARKYNSTLEAALNENNIPVDVYRNLIKSVNDNLEPLHRWGTLRKKALKLDKIHVYDTYVSLFPSVTKTYSYDEAVQICIEALKPLGDDYIKNLKTAFGNRWVDVYETKGKRSGAYSTGAAIGVHPYVLMNWNGTLNEVFTLAHEMGHNMHSYYSSISQPYIYADYPIFLAEVASTLNEALLLDYLIKKATTKTEKMALIEKFIMNIKGTFYRQARFADFELLVNDLYAKGEALPPDRLSQLFGEMYQKYWGTDMEMDPEEAYCWARIPHFYYNFYVYQYSVCFAASQAIAEKIFTEGKPAIDKYLEFLKSGRSEYPIPTLAKAGVDMSKPDPILAVSKKMNSLLDELEKLMNEK
jgi:oligoendopeptidase F